MIANPAMAIYWKIGLNVPGVRQDRRKRFHKKTSKDFKVSIPTRNLLAFLVILGLIVCRSAMVIYPAYSPSTSIIIQNFAFSPQNVSIQAGDNVTWMNNDQVIYTLWFRNASDGSTYLLSPPVNPGTTWTHVFPNIANLTYYDFDRLQINGQLNVVPALAADFGPTFSSNLAIVFGATVSGGTIPYKFLWTFGDGSSSTLSQPQHTYQSSGTFSVTLTITDSSSFNTLSFTVIHLVTVGFGGGSVATGTLVTMADGSKIPVEKLHVGMKVMSYGMTTHQFEISTITKFYSVVVDNYMTIRTDIGQSLTTDQNPHQTLYVRFSNGTWTLLPVTQLKAGYYLFDTPTETWVRITSIQYHNGGQYVMWDIYTTYPGNYIANDLLDPLKA